MPSISYMKKLKNKVIPISQISAEEIYRMYHLMQCYYDNVCEDVFINDLMEKDFCVILFTEEDKQIQGFSTQKMIALTVNGEPIHGVFSGDTIIDKAYWGHLDLFQCFTQHFFEKESDSSAMYWFLISKGYKTYKILPTFFDEFYPNYHTQAPERIAQIMKAFGTTKFPEEYNISTGVVEYKLAKDRLKNGVADICEKQLKDKHVQFFLQQNPGHAEGNDLVCITRLHPSNVRDSARKLLLI